MQMSSLTDAEALDTRIFTTALREFMDDEKKIQAMSVLRTISERNPKTLKLLWYKKDVVNKMITEIVTLFKQSQQPNFLLDLTCYGCQIVSVFVLIAKEEDLLQVFVHSQIPLKLTKFLKNEYGAPTSFLRFPLLGLVLTIMKSQEIWAPQWLVTTEIFPNLLSAALHEKDETLDVSLHAITEFIAYDFGLNYLSKLSPRVFAVDAVLRNVIVYFSSKTFTTLRARILYRCVLFCYCRLFRDVRIGCLLHQSYPELVQHLSQPFLYENNLDCAELLEALKDSVKAAENESVRRQKQGTELAQKKHGASILRARKSVIDGCAVDDLLTDLQTPMSSVEKLGLGMEPGCGIEPILLDDTDDDDIFNNFMMHPATLTISDYYQDFAISPLNSPRNSDSSLPPESSSGSSDPENGFDDDFVKN